MKCQSVPTKEQSEGQFGSEFHLPGFRIPEYASKPQNTLKF